jgi:hypothetical protein
MSLSDALNGALIETEQEPRDAAVVALARFYAATIDSVGDAVMVETLRDLGPKLLAALEALNMSPRARAAVKGAVTGGAVANPLDELQRRRADRAGSA